MGINTIILTLAKRLIELSNFDTLLLFIYHKNTLVQKLHFILAQIILNMYQEIRHCLLYPTENDSGQNAHSVNEGSRNLNQIPSKPGIL